MKALIVTDVQNDFCPGGSLAVENGDRIISHINKLTQSKKFDYIVATQDWHPEHHISFASSHHVDEFSTVGEKTVWPVHCVQDTRGAELRPSLSTANINCILRKGMSLGDDSYSGFADDSGKETGMRVLLEGMDEIYVCGIATEVCVKETVLDAITCWKDAPNVYLIKDACAAIDENNVEDIYNDLKNKGVKIITVENILE